MGYIATFLDSFKGTWVGESKTIIKCIKCKQNLKVPVNKGNLKVSCPKCKFAFSYSPHLLFKQYSGFILLLTGGILFGVLIITNLTLLIDLTDFYLLFIIPVGAVIFGLLINLGFISILAFLRTKGINYSNLLLIIISGLIVLFTFWLAQYIIYSEFISTDYSLIDCVVKTYKSSSLNIFGIVGGTPIPIIPPSTNYIESTDNIGIGSFGVLLLLLDHIGLFFSLPFLWALENSRIIFI